MRDEVSGRLQRNEIRRDRSALLTDWTVPPAGLQIGYATINLTLGPSMLQVQKKKLDSKFIHSLDKGLEVLERVARAGDLALSDLAHDLDWDKSTVFRLLATLMRRGYVEQDPETKRY